MIRTFMHQDAERESSKVPVISIDYSSMGQEGQEGLTNILVFKDRKMKNIFSHPVRAKGTAAESWIANRVCKDIRRLGCNRIVLKCDQEPSIIDIQNEVIRR